MASIRHYREWQFATVTDLRAWVLHNRDEIRRSKGDLQFSVILVSDNPIPELLEGAAIEANLTPHTNDLPGRCCDSCACCEGACG